MASLMSSRVLKTEKHEPTTMANGSYVLMVWSRASNMRFGSYIVLFKFGFSANSDRAVLSTRNGRWVVALSQNGEVSPGILRGCVGLNMEISW